MIHILFCIIIYYEIIYCLIIDYSLIIYLGADFLGDVFSGGRLHLIHYAKQLILVAPSITRLSNDFIIIYGRSDIFIAPFNVVQFMKVTLARYSVNLKSNFKEPYRKKSITPMGFESTLIMTL